MNIKDFRALLSKRFHIPKERETERAIRRFTLAEKTLFYFFAGLFILSSLLLIWRVNSAFLVDVPIRGGSITEGILGNPRFINPVLAISEADRSLTALVYSGLLRTSSNGELVGDLASNVSVSEDGLTYTVTLRDDSYFHDGEKVTVDDVIFTIQKIQDPNIKSPIFGSFAGVNVSKVDEDTLTLTLRRPFSPFMHSLTVGILPKHIWSSVLDDEFSFSQWNVVPVGSGPYKVEIVRRNSGGIPNYYELRPGSGSATETPYIGKIVFKFFPTEEDLLDAYKSGDIEAISGVSPAQAKAIEKDASHIVSSPLPRIFGVFFNQNTNKALLDKSVRQALNLAAPKEKIVDEVLGGYGVTLESALPQSLFDFVDNTPKILPEERLLKAQELLDKNGWVKNEETGILEKKSGNATLKLSLSLSTSDNPELKAVAEKVRDAWQELGAEVELKIYETGDLNQNIIRPRRYDALLFGEVIGRDADIFPFWHSSERNDPGLNIALYANSKVDKILSDARIESDIKKRMELYKTFDELVREDVPAVFLYSPNLIYLIPPKVMGVDLREVSTPRDRFLGVRDWFVETDSVWNIFVRNSN